MLTGVAVAGAIVVILIIQLANHTDNKDTGDKGANGVARDNETTPSTTPVAASPPRDVHASTGSPKEITLDLGGGAKLEMVLVPAGEFMMGNAESAEDLAAFFNKDHSRHPDSAFNHGLLNAEDFTDEYPQHHVRIMRPFYLGKYLVTQEQWEVVMGKNPSHFKGQKNPVESIGWSDCQVFLGKLNGKLSEGTGTFQLPTEAQWEYACRAGSTTRYCFGDDEDQLGEYAWSPKNSGGKTHPVGEKKPNAWGLYDMHGNVYEWCQDLYSDTYYAYSPTDDPTGPSSGSPARSGHVMRGGCWFSDKQGDCRSAGRSYCPFENGVHVLGFRVARTLAESSQTSAGSFVHQKVPSEINSRSSTRTGTTSEAAGDAVNRAGGSVVVVDLAAAMEAAGFQHVRWEEQANIFQFVRCGSPGESQPEDEAHQIEVRSKVYALLNRQVFTLSPGRFSEKGLFVGSTPVGLRLYKRRKQDWSGFAKLNLSRVEMQDTWFLTKNQTLQRCATADEEEYVSEHGGVLYYGESRSTDIFMISFSDAKTSSMIAANPSKFSMDIVFDDVQLQYPIEFDWGYYRSTAVFEHDRDSDYFASWNMTGALSNNQPDYFRVDPPKNVRFVTANLVAAILRDDQRNSVASYGGDYVARKLILPPLPPPSLSPSSPSPSPPSPSPPHVAKSRKGHSSVHSSAGRERGAGGYISPEEANRHSPFMPNPPGDSKHSSASFSNEEPVGKGPLTGIWTSATGARCRLSDDGTTVAVSLLSSTRTLREFTGKLTRRNEQADSKFFDGTLDVMFAGSSRRDALRTTATLDDADHLRLRFTDWPTYDRKGKRLGERVYSEVLMRSVGHTN
jgi:formylglycine-generating enzyme required for sulfatase activity